MSCCLLCDVCGELPAQACGEEDPVWASGVSTCYVVVAVVLGMPPALPVYKAVVPVPENKPLLQPWEPCELGMSLG